MMALVRGVMAAADGLRIEVEVDGVDVGEHRLCADAVDGAGGREERERRGDDFVAGADVEGHQGEDQCIGAGGAADRMAGVAVGRDFLFERRPLPRRG